MKTVNRSDKNHDDGLLDWIESYLEHDNQSDTVKQYTAAYWDACLQELINPNSQLEMLQFHSEPDNY